MADEDEAGKGGLRGEGGEQALGHFGDGVAGDAGGVAEAGEVNGESGGVTVQVREDSDPLAVAAAEEGKEDECGSAGALAVGGKHHACKFLNRSPS